jgi:hypothetical protein
MTEGRTAVLTPSQWEARDYRQSARDLDDWVKGQPGPGEDNATEYVAKLGLNQTGSVVIMSRAHDRVLVPTPARAALAAFALAQQPFGFTAWDVEVVEAAAERSKDQDAADALLALAQRIQALVPPASGGEPLRPGASRTNGGRKDRR